MRTPILLALSLASFALLGADCSFEDLIDPEALGIPDPCDVAEISCNGIDEDCDGVDDCAGVPEGSEALLLQALGLLDLDCDGLAALRDAALGPLELQPDAACPTHADSAEGPLWDGVETCPDFEPEEGTCSRMGEATTTAWSGGCDRDEVSVLGGLSFAAGQVTENRSTDAETRLEALTQEVFSTTVPDGMSMSTGGTPSFRVSGEGDRTGSVVRVTDPESTLTTTETDGCSLSLDLESATAPAPLPFGASSTLARVQWRRTEGDLVTWTDARNGNGNLPIGDTVAEYSWVRDQEGGAEPGDCTQSGSVEVSELDLGTTNRRWSLRLNLYEACVPCGDLLADGEFAGVWCNGRLQ